MNRTQLKQARTKLRRARGAITSILEPPGFDDVAYEGDARGELQGALDHLNEAEARIEDEIRTAQP